MIERYAFGNFSGEAGSAGRAEEIVYKTSILLWYNQLSFAKTQQYLSQI